MIWNLLSSLVDLPCIMEYNSPSSQNSPLHRITTWGCLGEERRRRQGEEDDREEERRGGGEEEGEEEREE